MFLPVFISVLLITIALRGSIRLSGSEDSISNSTIDTASTFIRKYPEGFSGYGIL